MSFLTGVILFLSTFFTVAASLLVAQATLAFGKLGVLISSVIAATLAVTLAWAANNIFYKRLIWIKSPHYYGGWWVYGLVSLDRDEKKQIRKVIPIVGRFFVSHSPTSIAVTEGSAYRAEDYKKRVRWDGRNVTVDRSSQEGSPQRVGFIFRTDERDSTFEGYPGTYEGYFDLIEVTSSPTIPGANKILEGTFLDFPPRQTYSGRVRAERIRSAETLEDAERFMKDYGANIVMKVRKEIPDLLASPLSETSLSTPAPNEGMESTR